MAYFPHNKITQVWGYDIQSHDPYVEVLRGQGKNVSTRDHSHNSIDIYLKIG